MTWQDVTQTNYETMQGWIDDRNQLILWLSKTYNDNDPTFPFFGLDGERLEESIRNYRTWCIVVRGMEADKVDEWIENLLDSK